MSHRITRKIQQKGVIGGSNLERWKVQVERETRAKTPVEKARAAGGKVVLALLPPLAERGGDRHS